jgi:uncharacterized membrane protein
MRLGTRPRTEREIAMSTLVAVVFDDETTAFEMRAALVKMQKDYLIELEDAVVVTKGQNGKSKLDQAVSLTAVGAVGGGFWGLLVGMLFLNPLLGTAVGMTAGAISGKFRDIGISDQMMKELAQSFKPGTSALFVLLRKVTADKVLDGLKAFAGRGKYSRRRSTRTTRRHCARCSKRPDRVLRSTRLGAPLAQTLETPWT